MPASIKVKKSQELQGFDFFCIFLDGTLAKTAHETRFDAVLNHLQMHVGPTLSEASAEPVNQLLDSFVSALRVFQPDLKLPSSLFPVFGRRRSNRRIKSTAEQIREATAKVYKKIR